MKRQELPQDKYGVDVFRQELPRLKMKEHIEVIPLTKAFYLSVGMVLNADEKTAKGEFTIDDLLSDTRDKIHSAPFAGSKDVDEFGIRRIRYLEYGANTRVPSKVRRPTFPELYDRMKLMVAEFGGFALDDGTWDSGGYLKCNHSVFILMPWHLLSGVSNTSISSELKALGKPDRDEMEMISAQLDPWYVLGFLNSEMVEVMLTGVKRSAIANRRQPDDLRQIVVPLPDSKMVKQVATLSKKAAEAQKQLLLFRSSGWEIALTSIRSPGTIPAKVNSKNLSLARASWNLVVHKGNVRLNGLHRVDNDILRGKQKLVTAPVGTDPDALDWLVHQFNSFPEGTTFETAEKDQMKVPATPADGKLAYTALASDIKTVAQLLDTIGKIKEEISNVLRSLFEEISHPAIH
jgi:hypothetical protein